MGFLRDSAGTLLLQGLAAALQFLAGVLLSRALLAEGRGAYAVLVLIPNSFLILTNLGLGTAVARQAVQEIGSARRAVANLLLAGLFLGGLTSLLLLGARPWLQDFVGHREAADGLLLAAAAMPLLFLDRYLGNLLVGLHAVLAAQAVKLLQVAVLAVGVGLLFLRGSASVAGVLALWLASFAVGDLAGLATLLRRVPRPWPPDLRLLRAAVGFGARLMPGTIAVFLLFRSDLFLVQHFRGLEATGVYAVATSLALFYQLLGNAAERAFTPRALRSSPEEARQRTPLLTRCYVLLNLPVAAVAASLAFPLVPLVYGQAFAGAALPFILFLPGLVLGNVGNLVNTDLIGRGRPGWGSWSATASLALNLLLNLWWIPRLGIVGAALASLVAYSLHGLILGLVYRRLTGVPLHRLYVPGPADLRALLRILGLSPPPPRNPE